jgi:hypothetical protein
MSPHDTGTLAFGVDPTTTAKCPFIRYERRTFRTTPDPVPSTTGPR